MTGRHEAAKVVELKKKEDLAVKKQEDEQSHGQVDDQCDGQAGKGQQHRVGQASREE